jgi:hypothetical protein
MDSRFNYVKTAPGAYKAMIGLEHYLHECGLEESLIRLIKLRASQINERLRPFFNEKELCDLTLAVSTINAWNRLAISARTEPGTYQPARSTGPEASRRLS